MAGDPLSGCKWIKRSLRQMAKEVGLLGSKLSHVTLGRLLKQLGFSLKRNLKVRSATSHHPDRDRQFKHLEQQRATFYEEGWPVISVDTKKKELIDNYYQTGRKWLGPGRVEEVNDHDWPSEALGRAVP